MQGQPEAVTGAQRVIVLAKEGLDMLAQVTAVVDGTIVSAEEWIEKLGRRRNNANEPGAGPGAGALALPEKPEAVLMAPTAPMTADVAMEGVEKN